ncbi:hypothetical protein [Spirosoma horti]
MSTEADARALLASIDSPANGLCFCTGSLYVVNRKWTDAGEKR